MSESHKILQKLDEESIKWQRCAICDKQKLRVVHEANRPDFVICDECHSAYVLEDGGKMRMMYGRLPDDMPHTRAFALKRWQSLLDIRAMAAKERHHEHSEQAIVRAVGSLDDLPIVDRYGTNMDAILALEAQKSEALYNRARKIETPPRRLRETGDLPNLDDLFKDI